MTDPRRPRRSNHTGQGPTEPRAGYYQRRTDPAYSGQVPYTPTYGGVPPQTNPIESQSTDRIPQYWLQNQSRPQWQRDQLSSGEPPDGGSPGPKRSKPPRWLWIGAGAAVLLVVALVIALVIANGTAKKGTAVPPLPAMPGSKTPPSGSASPSSSAQPTVTSSAAPSTTTPTTKATASETVAYNVTGDGRAISISYIDDDGIRQIEFNVALPWSKSVTVPRSASQQPSVTIVNIGHDVTCSVTVDGVAGPQHTGVGWTMCEATG